MSDRTIVLPPELRPSIQGPEAGISSRQNGGIGLRPRPAEGIPEFDNDEIVIDLPGTGIRLGIGEDGEIHAPFIRENREERHDFGENLALKLDDATLNGVAEDVVPGVEADDQSRAPWYEQITKGYDLLGTRIEDIPQGGNRRNISRAGHPLLMEAIVKYQAGAEAELLPAAGPVKVATIGRVPQEEEQRAKAFQDDFNYFLTDVAREYYPDTARMLMQQAYCGLGYKKIYRCPIRQRPSSESVLATDLIVSEEATDLDNALRVTHRIEMTLPVLRRMQIVGQYRDVEIGDPAPMQQGGSSMARRGIRANEVTVAGFGRPQDLPYEIWETDVYLDAGYHGIDGHFELRSPDGLPLPYKVTIDRNSRKILGMWRNWRPADNLYLKKNMYVKYGLVPSLYGYHDWGFLQLLGNQTRALRAILRLLIDAGMFSNFPGGIKAKNARAGTNEIAPGPGEFVDVDIPSNSDITKMVMPMPYKGPDAVFVQLMELIKQDAMRLGGTVQLEVGEGRANVPVGTVMAMIEQQVQVMAGVHKRNHRSQKDEFRKLRELFAENPEDFSMMVRDRPRDPEAPYKAWEIAEEFTDLNVQPQSDPNVPSSVHKLMMGNVLLLLAQQAPNYFDMPEVLSNAVTAIGADPARFIVRPDQSQPPPPDPKVVAATIRAQTDQEKGIVQAKIEADKLQMGREKLAAETARAAAGNETVRQVAQMRRAGDREKAGMQHESAMQQAGFEHQSAVEQLHHDAALHPEPPKVVKLDGD